MTVGPTFNRHSPPLSLTRARALALLRCRGNPPGMVLEPPHRAGAALAGRVLLFGIGARHIPYDTLRPRDSGGLPIEPDGYKTDGSDEASSVALRSSDSTPGARRAPSSRARRDDQWTVRLATEGVWYIRDGARIPSGSRPRAEPLQPSGPPCVVIDPGPPRVGRNSVAVPFDTGPSCANPCSGRRRTTQRAPSRPLAGRSFSPGLALTTFANKHGCTDDTSGR